MYLDLVCLRKSENVCDVCLDCLDLIFVTFKLPVSRSLAYCDCNPIRAFETFNISKEPISKTSRFWVVIGSALSKGWHSGPEAFHVGVSGVYYKTEESGMA